MGIKGVRATVIRDDALHLCIRERIKALRATRNMSLEDLATAAGHSKSRIWEIENSEATSPTISVLSDLSKALRVPVTYLISDNLTLNDAEDAFLYAEYLALPPADKRRLRRICEIFK